MVLNSAFLPLKSTKAYIRPPYFTKRLLWPNIMSYYERVAILNLELLELRRIKCDMYYCFKILNNLTCLGSNAYFTADTRNLKRVLHQD